MNTNHLNNIMAWISIFVLSWLLLLKKVEINPLSIGFFVFFLLVSLFSSGFERIQKEKPKTK